MYIHKLMKKLEKVIKWNLVFTTLTPWQVPLFSQAVLLMKLAQLTFFSFWNLIFFALCCLLGFITLYILLPQITLKANPQYMYKNRLAETVPSKTKGSCLVKISFIALNPRSQSTSVTKVALSCLVFSFCFFPDLTYSLNGYSHVLSYMHLFLSQTLYTYVLSYSIFSEHLVFLCYSLSIQKDIALFDVWWALTTHY